METLKWIPATHPKSWGACFTGARVAGYKIERLVRDIEYPGWAVGFVVQNDHGYTACVRESLSDDNPYVAVGLFNSLEEAKAVTLALVRMGS